MRVGITGQNGFIGIHLFNSLNLNKNKFKTINFEKEYFEDSYLLEEWVKKCDVIVHLAALSRSNYSNVVYDTNINLVCKLITTLDKTKVKPHILFASSIQEELDTEYGKSKKEGRILFHEWAKINDVTFTGIKLPNVFGPFARPKYASVIATFSYQLIHNENPVIFTDNELKLIYIDDLINLILKCIINKENNPNFNVAFTDKIKVSEILNKLNYFNDCHSKYFITPEMKNQFDKNLYNTFLSYTN